ncbi:MAG: YunC family protein [Candidatus Omnitrophica bacterium]|nr:YunC family protein [Candidatus Omnitrophota bacterium]
MEIYTKAVQTKNGQVEGVQVKWTGFNILLFAGGKGFLGCGAFDLEALDKFGVACAIVESSPENPIGTLERFLERKIARLNSRAQALGIKPGMDCSNALEVLA